VLAFLLVASGFAIVPSMPFVQRVTADEPYVETPIGSDLVYVAPNDARSVESLRAIVASARAPRPDAVGRCALHRPLSDPRAEIARVGHLPGMESERRAAAAHVGRARRVDWVLLLDRPIGGDPNMILPVSHPRVFERLTLEFERVKIPGAPDSLFLLGRKGAR
jgi:hypothetical protein